jgi:cell division protein FtsL
MTALPAERGERRRASARPALRVVETPAPRRTLAYAVLLVALSAAAVFGTVAVNALGAGDAVAARALEREGAEAERRYSELIADVARLENPARIERVALEELGMVRPEVTRFVVVTRPLPEDRRTPTEMLAGGHADPLKPILSAER